MFSRRPVYGVRFVLLCWVLTPLLEGKVGAATRTVQFAGIGVNDPLTVEVSNWSFMTSCTIAVANLGSTDQVITGFDRIAYANSSYVAGTTPSKIFPYTDFNAVYYLSFLDHWRGDSGKTGCIGADKFLAPGDVCFVQYAVITAPWTGKIAPCFGRVTVKDRDDKKPGSIIATGSVYLNQEAMVLGGQLSGAYYASQTHVMTSDFGNTKALKALPEMPTNGSGDTAFSYDGAQNMNVFCSAACQAYGAWGNQACDEHCGFSSQGQDGFWTHHITGWTMKTPEVSFKDGFSLESVNGDDEKQDMLHLVGPSLSPAEHEVPTPVVLVSPGPATPPTNANIRTMMLSAAESLNTSVNTMMVELANDIRDDLQRLDRAQYHSVTNAHFAGGMVYEMEIGAYSSICSAHNQYALDGGLEFRHSDGVDSHAVYDSNPIYDGARKAPPERLLCAHRHLKPDLLMRVGSTSPIVVNGGMPF